MNFRDPKAYGPLLVVAVIEYAMFQIMDSAKHSAGKMWADLISVISLGSKTVENMPYSTAALNPYPLPSMMILTVMILLLTFGPISFPLIRRTILPFEKWFVRERPNSRKSIDGREKFRKKLGVLLRALWTINLCLTAMMVLAGILLLNGINKAIAIRRTFDADVRIITPYMSTSEKAGIEARFASVETRAQFDSVMESMKLIAKRGNSHLRSEGLD